REPLSLAAWPAWRTRLLAWLNDPGPSAEPAFAAARDFLRRQAGDRAQLPRALEKDALAWLLLAQAFLDESNRGAGGRKALAAEAERAARRSLQVDPKAARAHDLLARIFAEHDERDARGNVNVGRMKEARKHL